MHFPRSLDITERPARRLAGFFRNHPATLEAFFQQREMGCHLAVHLTLGALAEAEIKYLPEGCAHTHYTPSLSRRSTRPDIRRQRAVSASSAFSPDFVIE